MGVLHSYYVKNIFYDKMDLRRFYFDVVNKGALEQSAFREEVVHSEEEPVDHLKSYGLTPQPSPLRFP